MKTFKVTQEGVDYCVQSGDSTLPSGRLIYAYETDDYDYLYEYTVEQNGIGTIYDGLVFEYDKALRRLGEELEKIIGEPIEFEE